MVLGGGGGRVREKKVSTETLNSLFSLCRSLGHAIKTAQSHADVLSRSHRETNQ